MASRLAITDALSVVTSLNPYCLDNTQAAREVFVKSGPTAKELFVYNGATMVADLPVSGHAQIYAENKPTGRMVIRTAGPFQHGRHSRR